jgi:hypothetical protein
MQDSLGGNAKTLMFVNISPADYNSVSDPDLTFAVCFTSNLTLGWFENGEQDETVTSLAYAARVKLITNSANKNQDSEEVAKLKAIIKALKVPTGAVMSEFTVNRTHSLLLHDRRYSTTRSDSVDI